MTKTEIYTVGGTVQAGGGVYIPRRADDQLLALCRAGTFAYVLSSRQMGKSSLMVRTMERLVAEGVRCVSIDLNAIGTQVTAEQWYLGLLTIMEAQLGIQTDTIAWWQRHAHLGVTQRLTLFFQKVILPEIAERTVIFVDEIDTTLSLAFTDDFYAAIRSLYNARARVPDFQRISFVLIGVATPSDLINDAHRTPFNIGERVDVADFTLQEALPLTSGLGLVAAEARSVLAWILDWTGGHPYLTQRLCSAIALQRRASWTKADVDQAVAGTFFGAINDKDQNLQFVRDMLTKGAPAADRAAMLLTYREILLGFRAIRDEEQSVVKTHLKLSGIVRREGTVLWVRNRIYSTVFNVAWIKEHLPANWARAAFTVGGSVAAGDGIYISRKADNDLRGACLSSDYAYVLGPGQIGKSSLVVHTAERLAADGIQAAVVSLQKLAGEEPIVAETWYPRLLSAIADQLLLETNVANWWQERPHLNFQQRLTTFFQDLVLVAVQSPVVIFVDEVEKIADLAVADDFFSAIGHLYANRTKVTPFKRLSFVLSGTTDRRDLIRDIQGKPIGIERQIDLADWTEAEALPLAEGLGMQSDVARKVLVWVLGWTGGHPYLTQRLCQAITAQNRGGWTEADVDHLVAVTFFGEQSSQDLHLQAVRELLMASSRYGAAPLNTYRKIRRNKRPVPDDDRSPGLARLKLAGVVRSENGVLRVRNHIYAHVFDRRWARTNAPLTFGRRFKRIAVGLAVIVLLAVATLAVLDTLYREPLHSLVGSYPPAERRLSEVEQAINGLWQGVPALAPARATPTP